MIELSTKEFQEMAIKITCITKDNGYHENPHTAIQQLGWLEESTGKRGIISRLDLYNWIKEGGRAYVRDAVGDVAYLITSVTSLGTKYVKTIADNTRADNLLKLIECKG